MVEQRGKPVVEARTQPMEIVAEPRVIDEIRQRGGAVYVWPRKLRCCGGTIVLDAATDPGGKEFRLEVDMGRCGSS